MTDRRWLYLKDVAALLDVSPITIRRYIADGRIPRPMQVGRNCKLRWRAEDIHRWLEKGCAA